jgi:hypothetical protein
MCLTGQRFIGRKTDVLTDREICDSMREMCDSNPQKEDEITPKMLEAGLRALYVRDWGEEPGDWAVTRVYRAMTAARVSSDQKLAVSREDETAGT